MKWQESFRLMNGPRLIPFVCLDLQIMIGDIKQVKVGSIDNTEERDAV